MSFSVTVHGFADLTPEEQAKAANNGRGKQLANYLRIQRRGATVYLESDAMEPEDALFSRDLNWIKGALAYAYQCGLRDGAEAVTNRGAQ